VDAPCAHVCVRGAVRNGASCLAAEYHCLASQGDTVDLTELAAHLEGVAKSGRPITYGALVRRFNLPQVTEAWSAHPLCAAFDRLDREDAEANRPFRTSVVINQTLNRPGDGFFKSLFELKHISARSEEQKMAAFLREVQAAKIYPWGERDA
jgi:hypothetical protein